MFLQISIFAQAKQSYDCHLHKKIREIRIIRGKKNYDCHLHKIIRKIRVIRGQ